MNISILYFGMLAEITGQSRELWPGSENMTAGELKKQLSEKYPQMQEKKFKVAVNQQIIDDHAMIPASSEVALLPPFAGG